MSTTVVYNGCRIINCQTDSFKQTIEFDASDTDIMYSKFTIRVTGMVVGVGAPVGSTDPMDHGYTPRTGGGVDGPNDVRALERQIMVPRKEFTYSIGPTVVVQARWNGNRVGQRFDDDVNNGPKPRGFSIVHVAAKAIRATFEIELCLVMCGDSADNDVKLEGRTYANGGQDAPSLSNKWTMSETRDANFYATLHLQGVIRQAYITGASSALRKIVVPPLADGFQRESMSFRVAPSGLMMDYTVTDKERFAAPPLPATTWNATYTNTSSGPGGFMQHANFAIMLEGPKNVHKQDLIARAYQIIEARLGDIKLSQEAYDKAQDENGGGDLYLLDNAAIVEHLDINRIELTARFRVVTEDPASYLAAQYEKMGEPLDPAVVDDYDPNQWPVPDVLNGPLGPFAMGFSIACDGEVPVPTYETLPPETISRYEDEYTPDGSSESIKSDEPKYSQDQYKKAYTYYEIDSEYSTVDGIAQLPVTGLPSSYEPGVSRSSAFCRIHQPMQVRIVRVKGERIGDWPALPEPTGLVPGPPRAILLSSSVVMDAPELNPDKATYSFRLQAKYTYGLERQITISESLDSGSSPVDTSSITQNTLKAANVRSGIIHS